MPLQVTLTSARLASCVAAAISIQKDDVSTGAMIFAASFEHRDLHLRERDSLRRRQSPHAPLRCRRRAGIALA